MWYEAITIIGVMIALFAVMITVIIWMVNKLDSDVKSCMTRLDGHAARIDQIYSTILIMIKEGKN